MMQPRSKNKHLLRNWLVLLFTLGCVAVIAAVLYYNHLKSPLDRNSTVRAFVVRKGESVSDVIQRLESEKFIRSSTVMKLYLRQHGRTVHIEAGDFKLSSAMTLDQIVDTLSKGSVDKWVTLLEGWRVEQVARALEDELGIDKEEFITQAKKYEGHLFPDTYLFNRESNISDIISVMRNTFEQRYSQDLQQQITAKGLTAEEGVILASLVEREARSDKVRTQIAGILLKRLKVGMALNIDATVQYAKDSQTLANGRQIEKFWQPITQEEYQSIKSPYNTYLYPGLPPAPICNPSLSSLQAVAAATASTPYLYYFHDADGNTYYAKTLEEHTENVRKHS